MRSTEIVPLAQMPGKKPTLAEQPVAFDSATGQHKLTLVKHRQQRAGLEVYGTSVNVLVGATGDHPVLDVSANTRDLGEFEPTWQGKKLPLEALRGAVAERKNDYERAVRALEPTLAQFEEPELVIWAGTADKPETPRLAVHFLAGTSDGKINFKFVVDAESSLILQQTEQAFHASVTGSVRGWVTPDRKTAHCAAPVQTALPYTTVHLDPQIDNYSWPDGSYALESANNAAQPLTASYGAGRYFTLDQLGMYDNPPLSTTLNVTPPASANLVIGSSDSHSVSASSVYSYVNRARDMLLAIEPNYPDIPYDRDFPLLINPFAAGNAGYSPPMWGRPTLIEFWSKTDDPTYGSAANTDVAFHEFGHHVVYVAGHDQPGSYHEGMADVIALLGSDDPGMWYGRDRATCNTPSRTADNGCDYVNGACSTCGQEGHDCGQTISGAFWEIRNELKLSNPSTYRDILKRLAIGSIQLFNAGSEIDPSVAGDLLLVDDDDGVLTNGTPHRREICQGLWEHDLDGVDCNVELDFFALPAGAGTTGDIEPGRLMQRFNSSPSTCASANPGYVFDHWVASNGINISHPNNACTYFTNLSTHGRIAAVFRSSAVEQKLSLTVLNHNGFANVANVKDGNASSTKADGPASAWIEFGLGGTFDVSKIRVAEDNAGSWDLDRYQVQCWNGSAWGPVLFTDTETTTVRPGFDEHAISNCRTDRVRVNLFNDNGSNTEVFEIELYSGGGSGTAGICGDRSVNPGEQCDSGGSSSASCDFDCTSRVCGDGYVNTAAGEQCDDGNTAAGDGCTPSCKSEVWVDIAPGPNGSTSPNGAMQVLSESLSVSMTPSAGFRVAGYYYPNYGVFTPTRATSVTLKNVPQSSIFFALFEPAPASSFVDAFGWTATPSAMPTWNAQAFSARTTDRVRFCFRNDAAVELAEVQVLNGGTVVPMTLVDAGGFGPIAAITDGNLTTKVTGGSGTFCPEFTLNGGPRSINAARIMEDNAGNAHVDDFKLQVK